MKKEEIVSRMIPANFIGAMSMNGFVYKTYEFRVDGTDVVAIKGRNGKIAVFMPNGVTYRL